MEVILSYDVDINLLYASYKVDLTKMLRQNSITLYGFIEQPHKYHIKEFVCNQEETERVQVSQQ